MFFCDLARCYRFVNTVGATELRAKSAKWNLAEKCCTYVGKNAVSAFSYLTGDRNSRFIKDDPHTPEQIIGEEISIQRPPFLELRRLRNGSVATHTYIYTATGMYIY